jgi:hypothetical protein
MPSKRTRGAKAVPVLGAAGLTLSLAGGASASAVGPASDVPTPRNTAPTITLGEEEISDVSLTTFYVFDKESSSSHQSGVQLARGGCGRGCGGRGCGGRGCGGRGCGCGGGCGGCGCWCLSTGGCRLC